MSSFSKSSPLVTIIRPPAVISKWADAGPLTPPLGPAYLAGSLVANGIRAQIVDALGAAPDQTISALGPNIFSIGLTTDQIVDQVSPDSDYIGISCTFSHDWPLIKEITYRLQAKFPRAVIVAGGEHVTALPAFTLQDCTAIEYVVLGEGEESFVTLIRALENGIDPMHVPGIGFRQGESVHLTPRRGRLTDVDAIPLPAWDLTPLENYLERGLSFGVNRGRTVPILATRGCPYSCTFCSSPAMWTTKWIARKPELVLNEIESYIHNFGATNIDFYDLTMIVRKDWILRFTSLIEKRGLNFTWQLPSGTRSEVIDTEVARALYRTGCRNLSYAPESGSREELVRIKKKISLPSMLHSMRSSTRAGLNLKANIVIGFPESTRKDLVETLKLLVKMAWVGTHDVSLSMFSAYPGSEMFRRMEEAKKVPKMDNEYFLSLNNYKDLASSVNWCEAISARELLYARLLGYFLFYGVSYLVRPWRAFITLKNVIRGREESRLEKSILNFVSRIYSSKKNSRVAALGPANE